MTEIPSPRSRPIGAGKRWISDAYALFSKSPWTWIGILLLMMLSIVGVSLIPWVGSLAVNLLSPVLSGGLVLGMKDSAANKRLTLSTLWRGFRPPFVVPLLLLGVAYLVITIIIIAVLAVLMFGSMGISAVLGNHDAQAASMGFGLVLTMLLIVIMGMLLSMATWFAAALIVLFESDPVAAIQASLSACIRNMLPLLVYGLLMMLLAIIAAIPLGLGLLIVAPVSMISIYTSCTDIFGNTGHTDPPHADTITPSPATDAQ